MAGRFGGIPGVPVYWHIAEVGGKQYETSDGFSGFGYIEATQKAAVSRFSAQVVQWWNS